MTWVLAILGAVSAFVLAIVLRGAVLVQLWLWFMVSTFHVVALTLPQALGLALVVGYLTNSSTRGKSEEEGFQPLPRSFVTSAAVLLVGWLIHQWM